MLKVWIYSDSRAVSRISVILLPVPRGPERTFSKNTNRVVVFYFMRFYIKF